MASSGHVDPPGVPPFPLGGRTTSSDGLARSGLVARDRELSDLTHALWQARKGAHGVVVLRGEPGVGKSALLAAAIAQAMDFVVVQLRGTAGEASSLPPQWPSALTALESDSPAVASKTRHDATLLDHLARALGVVAGGSDAPLLVTLDDAQWLPQWFPTALIETVASGRCERPVALLLAVRDTPHLPRLDVPGDQVFERQLGGFTHSQAVTLLERLDLEQPTDAVLKAVVEATGGVPEALVDVLSRLERTTREGWRPLPDPLPLGERLTAAFAEGLGQLPGDTRTALMVAASGRLPVPILRRVLDELELGLSALEPAARLGVVALGSNRIYFAHPLVRLAAYHAEPAESRSRAHASVSAVLAAAGAVEMAAAHATRSGRIDANTLVRLYHQGVRVALDRADPRTAAQHEEVLAELSTGDDLVGRHLARAAQSWIAAGQVERALVCLDGAAGLTPSPVVSGELGYQRARALLAAGMERGLVDELAVAAELVTAEEPARASAMLADAAAGSFLVAGSIPPAAFAGRAVKLATSVSSYTEAMARAASSAVAILSGEGDSSGELRWATSLLVSQAQSMSTATPQLAYVIGLALLRSLGVEATSRWVKWVDRGAAATGDQPLHAAARLLAAVVSLRAGSLDDASREAELAAECAVACGQRVIGVRAFAVELQVHVARGSYQEAFEAATRLFAHAADVEAWVRSSAYRSLAELELQRGRTPSALSWLRAAELEVASSPGGGLGHPSEPLAPLRWRAPLLPVYAEAYAYDRRFSDVADLVAVLEEAIAAGGVEAAWGPTVRGLITKDVDAAESLFESALELSASDPLLRARVEFWYGQRLAEEEMTGPAIDRVRSAISTLNGHGAKGWLPAFEKGLLRLEHPGRARGNLVLLTGEGLSDGLLDTEQTLPSPEARPPGVHPEPTARASRIDPHATWEIKMLGSFAAFHNGAVVPLPPSLAATALKIVALRGRILVEELVECLWPESAPGVGTRRLRNVLWRIRASCGDVLLRDDNFILLAPEAATDVATMRRLASQALDPTTPKDKAAELARNALSLYDGELLPGDRYADWAAATRESLARLHVQLIELLVDDALGAERPNEAISLLEQLIESDPYDEDHYVRAAELLVGAGNRRRAMAMLGRAERTLSELGIPPSAGLKRLARNLTSEGGLGEGSS